MKPLCVISCPIDTYSGYGSRSRDFVKALYELKKDEWNIKVLSQRWGNTPWNYIKNELKNDQYWAFLKDVIIPGNQLNQQPDYWFQITVPNEFQPIGKLYNVGVTAGIESTMCHPTWIDGINKMPLTLVSSNHAKNVIKNSVFQEKDTNNPDIVKREVRCEKPVEVLFEGLDTNKYFYIEPKDYPKTKLTESLNSIEESFNYLFVGHWLQGAHGHDRKNVASMIRMFLETFKNQKKKPGLILKTTRVSNSVMDREDILENIDLIRNSIDSKDLPNIYLLHGELNDEDMNLIYNHNKVKAMLCLTHGEGYCRPLLEFSITKKPIIASGWSGHLDFLKPEFNSLIPGQLQNLHPSVLVDNILIKESSWFYPDETASKAVMEVMFEKYDRYLENAKRQAFRSKTEFSMENMKDKLRQFVDAFPKPIPLQLPKLKKINVSN